MLAQRSRSVLLDQRGIALPLSLIVLILLSSLTLAFLGLSATEPMIATNLKRGEAALALAEAGIERAIWALSNPTASGVTDPATAPYDGQQLLTLPLGGYTIAITPGPGPGERVLTAHGYVVREGVPLPAQPAGLATSDIAAHRVVTLQVKAGSGNGGPGGDNTVAGPAKNLPGALTVAGTLQMTGNSVVDGNNQADGTPNNCAKKGGVTIRDKTKLPDNACGTPPCEVDNSISLSGSASAVGTPAQQELGYTDFAPYSFTDAQLAALKAIAQQEGTYIKPSSNDELHLSVVDGLIFVDTVNGAALGTPPDASKLANVKITGALNSGWLIVMGTLRIDGNVKYDGFIYAHNDLSYRGTGTGGIFGAILTGNVVDTVATVVDSDSSGNSKIFFDCAKVANGGGGLSQTVQDALKRVVVEISKGSWRELSN